MIKRKTFTLALLAILLLPTMFLGQDQPGPTGSAEIGGRYIWGDVYGRPNLGFVPSLQSSKFNEYRELRNGLFLRNLELRHERLFGTNNYLHLESQDTAYRDRSVLATVGQYGRFKAQFRWTEVPHTYSDTTRTFFNRTGAGLLTVAPAVKTLLQTTPSANIPATTLLQAGNMMFVTPSIHRRGGTALLSVDATARLNLGFSFTRENQIGTRPLGMIISTGPSATATSGYGVEIPEPMDYYTNILKAGTEYSGKGWGLQAGYTGSFFENNIGAIVFDNPFRTSDCRAAVTPTQCTTATQGPAQGRTGLYPSNQAHYLNFAGAFNAGRYLRAAASITPGWLRQDEAFVPYTTNSTINTCGDGTQACSSTAVLPANSLHGDKQTLAMNYSVVTLPWEKFQIKAAYRHYDYNNNTPSMEFTPVIGDMALPNLAAPEENKPFGYNRKNIEFTGHWIFSEMGSLKLGYEGEWMDRSYRDVKHSMENSLVSAVDLKLNKNLVLRASYRLQNRAPGQYENEDARGIACDPASLATARASFVFATSQPCERRFDEAARLRNRGDLLVQYSPTDRLSFSASASTTQDDYNRRGGNNSPTPLNFLTGTAATAGPYYLYGMLKDLAYNYTGDTTYNITRFASVFAEYSYERYHRRTIGRVRSNQSTPGTPPAPTSRNGCGPNSLGVADLGICDSPNNDFESSSRDFVHVWSTGVDVNIGRKASLSTWYSLAAAKGRVLNRALGTVPATFLTNPTPLANNIDRFIMTTTNAAMDYPETVSRSHEVFAVFTYKLTKNIMPKIEYRYQQFDNKDYQTGGMNPFMGCVSTSGVPASGGAPSVAANISPGCPVVGPTLATPMASPYYPYFVVGDPAAARYMFMGVDQPSYRAHMLSAGIVFTF